MGKGSWSCPATATSIGLENAEACASSPLPLQSWRQKTRCRPNFLSIGWQSAPRVGCFCSPLRPSRFPERERKRRPHLPHSRFPTAEEGGERAGRTLAAPTHAASNCKARGPNLERADGL